jgi:autotransporter-associated beta strand protein
VVNGLSGAGTVDNKVAGTPLMTVGDNDQTSTFSGVIKNTAGTLSLCKLGNGTLSLSGANTYTGDTVVQNGTLSLSPIVAGGTLADTADVKLYTGGILELNTSSTDTIRSLYIDGVGQVTGTWGGTGSTATNKTSLITGTGLLNVGTLGGTLTYSISGTVTLNGAGLAGVTVSDGMQSATTASDGTYTISAVPDNATYTVTASAGGYAFAPSSASVTVKGTNVTGNNYTATVGAGSITLTGPLDAVNTTYGTASATPTSFTVSGTGLTPASGNLTVAALSGYEYSTSLAGTYTSTLLLPYTSSALSSTTVYVRLAATAGVGSSPYSGDISVSGGGVASPATIASASNTVSKAALSVTADNQTKGYGQTVAFGSGSTLFTSSSLQNGETITSVTLACDGGAAGAAVGIYPITPSAATGSLDPHNYDITYNITGELTVLDLNTYAFGTSNTGVLVLDGDGKIVTRGQAPIIQTTEGSALVQLTYARLKDSGCTYSAEFSSNLGVWLPSDDPSLIYPPGVPTEVAVDNGDDMEVVSVKFPIFRDNGGSYEKMEQNFSRIKVTTH